MKVLKHIASTVHNITWCPKSTGTHRYILIVLSYHFDQIYYTFIMIL